MHVLNPDHHIRTAEAALFLGLSPKTLGNWRVRRVGPAWSKAGARAVVYRVGDLIAWVEQRRQTDAT